MAVFEVEKHIENWNLDADTLASEYGFHLPSSNAIRRVYTAPKRISFGGREFVGEFLFNGDRLIRIYLIPIIEGVTIPNYPSEEYERTKIEYCKKILEEIYGDKVTETSVVRETEKYTIRCSAVPTGIEKYTGGNIIIDMKER